MSATDLPSVPASVPDDDAPEPRTPWTRWALAAVIGLPLAAAYGAVATVVGQALFLGPAEAAAFVGKRHDLPSALMMWCVTAATSFLGIAVVAREVLAARAARRTGVAQHGHAQGTRPGLPRWALPVIMAGSPVVAIAISAAVGGVVALFESSGRAGMAATVYSGTAGWILLIVMFVGWVALARPRVLREADPHHDESIESAWLQRAVYWAFRDVLIAAAVGGFLLAVTDARVLPSLPLIGVTLFALVDVAVRILLLRRREGRG